MKDNNIVLLTSSENIKNTKEYKSIAKCLTRMDRSGVLLMGAGFCISVSDMVQVALLQEGIKSRIVECKLTLKHGEDIAFVGFEDILNPGEIDTHVVVVTETNPPMLIDASIAHRVNSVVVDEVVRLQSDKLNILADFRYLDKDLILTYQEKLNSKVPYFHQKSILDRIDMDNKINKNISLLKKLNYIGIGLSLFAVIAVVNQIFRWFI